MVARKRPTPKPVVPAQPVKRPTFAAGGLGFKKKEEQETWVTDDKTKVKLRDLDAHRQQNAGWSEQAPQAMEFPLVTTKRALLEGLRHHIMRLNRGSKEKETVWDVTDQTQFPRPVTLHRRDPRLPPANRVVVKDEFVPTNPSDEAEAERMRQQKADREAQRAIDQAQIAPVVKGNEPPKKPSQKTQKASGYYAKNTDEQQKQKGVRYEETLPWHLEDADGKAGVWVGSYVAGLSDLNCALVIDGAKFRMIPLERYYQFNEKPRFNTLSLDDAERMMQANKDVKRWVMINRESEEKKREKDETRQILRGRVRVKTESSTSRRAPKTERQDDFDLDMSGDEFQDDDDNAGFDQEDLDTKESKDRVRREQVGANLFGEGDEDKVAEEEREQELEKLKRKLIGKQTVKKLMKLEHATGYQNSDSEDGENPFADDTSVRPHRAGIPAAIHEGGG